MRDGVIAFAEGAIDAATTRTRFLALIPGARLVIDNPPYRTYRFGPSAVGGRPFYANVVFVDEALQVIRMTAAGGAASWDEVDAAADKRTHDRWLRDEFGLGPTSKFAWGTIASVIDRRAGAAFIAIDFGTAAVVPRTTGGR